MPQFTWALVIVSLWGSILNAGSGILASTWSQEQVGLVASHLKPHESWGTQLSAAKFRALPPEVGETPRQPKALSISQSKDSVSRVQNQKGQRERKAISRPAQREGDGTSKALRLPSSPDGRKLSSRSTQRLWREVAKSSSSPRRRAGSCRMTSALELWAPKKTGAAWNCCRAQRTMWEQGKLRNQCRNRSPWGLWRTGTRLNGSLADLGHWTLAVGQGLLLNG